MIEALKEILGQHHAVRIDVDVDSDEADADGQQRRVVVRRKLESR